MMTGKHPCTTVQLLSSSEIKSVCLPGRILGTYRFSPSIQVCNRDENGVHIWSQNEDFLHHILAERQTKLISEIFQFDKFRFVSLVDASIVHFEISEKTIHNSQQKSAKMFQQVCIGAMMHMHVPLVNCSNSSCMQKIQIHQERMHADYIF